MKLPFYIEIDYIEPARVAQHYAKKPWLLWLDSNAKNTNNCNHYSFIAAEPFSTFVCKGLKTQIDSYLVDGEPFSLLQQQLQKYQCKSISSLPPFQGGAAGYFGYELCHVLENIPYPEHDNINCPDAMLGFYDVVISFDHQQQRSWVVSTGFPEVEISKRHDRAVARANQFIGHLSNQLNDEPAKKSQEQVSIKSNFTKQSYEDNVRKAVGYIYSGDIFEVNISQQFQAPLASSPFEFYQNLREVNPAPFAAYLAFPEINIASASPERFLRVDEGRVEARPIKGTCKRSTNLAEDETLAAQLKLSEKDRAENIMIVDLMRNDLSKVCEDTSVKVTSLCQVESFEYVHHLVSVVEGKLLPKHGAVDLLKASFPGGSITGAPKIRAMQIITEIEETTRGPYCGAIGYIGFNGQIDTSIAIRTCTIKNNNIYFQAGGAVVSDSNPQDEYNETLIKAHGIHQALKETEKQYDIAN